jgi:hypothetical protein
MIDRDAELRAEVEAMASRPIAIAEMHRRLVGAFGDKRVPGPRSLARYVRRRGLARGLRTGGRSKIDRDPKLRAKVDAMVSRPITLKEMRRRLLGAFGDKRVPGLISIAQYVRRRRLALGFRPGGLRISPAPDRCSDD